MVNGFKTFCRRLLILNLIVCIQIWFIHEILDGPYQPVTKSIARKVFRNCCIIIWKLWTPIIVGLPYFIDEDIRKKLDSNLLTLLVTTAAMQAFLRLVIWALVEFWDWATSTNISSSNVRDGYDSNSTTSLIVIHKDTESSIAWDTSWIILFIVLHLCRILTNYFFQCFFTIQEAMARDSEIQLSHSHLILVGSSEDDTLDESSDSGNENIPVELEAFDEEVVGEDIRNVEGDEELSPTPEEDLDSSDDSEEVSSIGSGYYLDYNLNFDNNYEESEDSNSDYELDYEYEDGEYYLPVLLDQNNNDDVLEEIQRI